MRLAKLRSEVFGVMAGLKASQKAMLNYFSINKPN